MSCHLLQGQKFPCDQTWFKEFISVVSRRERTFLFHPISLGRTKFYNALVLPGGWSEPQIRPIV